VAKPPVSDHVVATVRERILGGELLPGAHLIEQELAAEFGVGRPTVREALRRLLADELVELLPHRGVRVRRLSPRDLAELYVVREPVECLAARLAAGAPTATIASLRRLHREAARAIARGDRLGYLRLNARFHHGIAEATGNRTLITLLERLNTQLIGYQFVAAVGPAELETSQRDHGELVAALAAGDPARAEALMRRHLRASRRAILAPVAAALEYHRAALPRRRSNRAERRTRASR